MHICATYLKAMITKQQRNNIHKLTTDDCLEIMHECADKSGIVSVDEYSSIMKIPKRTIYQMISDGKLKCFEIGIHKYPCINE